MVTVDLDGNMIATREELHEIFREALNLEDYYGCNLDALYDVLSTYSEEVLITISNMDMLCAETPNYGERVINVIQVAMEENPDYILLRMEDDMEDEI